MIDMINIACNVSGYVDSLPKPVLQHDSGLRYEFIFDAGSVSRGHFAVADGAPANGWTIIWADHSLRVWLSLKYQDSDTEHPPLEPGSYEAALFGLPGVLAYAPLSLPVVTAAGVDLVSDGKVWIYRGATHFMALARKALGQGVVDYEGALVYRVLGTAVNIANQCGVPVLTPDVYPTYFQTLSDLADELAGRGKYLDFCALADMQLLGWDKNRQRSFLSQCVEVLRSKSNVLFDLGNEPWNNGWGYDIIERPDLPFLCTRGSVEDADGEYGYGGLGGSWDAIRPHTRRDFPKMLTHCALPDPNYTYGKPIIIDEPFKLCDPTHGGYFDPRMARIAGQLGRGVNGICFHTPSGVASLPLNGSEAACRAAFFS